MRRGMAREVSPHPVPPFRKRGIRGDLKPIADLVRDFRLIRLGIWGKWIESDAVRSDPCRTHRSTWSPSLHRARTVRGTPEEADDVLRHHVRQGIQAVVAFEESLRHTGRHVVIDHGGIQETAEAEEPPKHDQPFGRFLRIQFEK